MPTAKRTGIVDLLQQFLKQGVKPPQALLNAAAENEALQKPAIDPVQMAAGAYAFGPLAQLGNEAAGPILNRLPLSELLGPAGKVPGLISMAQKAVSGQGKGIPAGAKETRTLAGAKPWWAEEPLSYPTKELSGVKLPGGAVAAKGTASMPGAKVPGDPQASSFPTHQLELDDAIDMSVGDAQAGGPWKDLVSLLGGTAKGQIPADFLEPGPNTTSPLPPQGGVTRPFGSGNQHALSDNFALAKIFKDPQQAPTEKLTPFEAHSNVTDWNNPGSAGFTKELPGSVLEEVNGPGLFDRRTRPLELDNRTMSLEPPDIDEMAGRETPATGDLLSALAKNLGPKDTLPLPENTLYHGMNVFGHKTPKDALAAIAEQGMKGGWFSEEPHQAFGPHFIATTPEDLPPLLIRSKQFNVDPEKEIIPRWKQMNTENLHTAMKMRGKSPAFELSPDEVKGRPAVRSNWPNIHQLVGADEGGGGFPLEKGGHVVDPSKLFLTNTKGDITGRMAPKGGKPNAIGQLWDRVKAFRNVLEEGSGNKQGTIDSVFKKLFGEDPEHAGATPAQKIAKLKQFVAQPEPENPALAKIWKPFMDEATAALEEAL